MALYLSFASALPAISEPSDLVVSPEVAYKEPFTGFSTRCPQRIIYRPTLNISLATFSADGEELIVLDHSLQVPFRRYEHNFLAAHECAHHFFGDAKSEAVFTRKTVAGTISRQELRADCWAAEFMGVMGQDKDVKKMAESFYRRGRKPAGGGYPSGYDRAVTVQKCWRKGRNERFASEKLPELGVDQD